MQLAPANALVARLADVYTVYGQRNDRLAALRQYIPADSRTVGLIASSTDLEVALWRPFGQRRVVDLVNGHLDAEDSTSPPDWIVLKEGSLGEQGFGSLADFQRSSGGQIVGHEVITSTVGGGPEDWYVVKLSH
jgi:hypothetical protein